MPPHLYQRKSGIWVIIDQGREASTGSRDRAAAEAALHTYQTGTVRLFVERYARTHTVKLQHFIERGSRAILAWWGDTPIAEVDEASCRAYYASRKPRYKDSTIRHELKLLKAALRAGGHTPNMWMPPQPPGRGEYFLTRKQVAERLRIARRSPFHRHLCRYILIGVYSGTRKGVLLDLRWLPTPGSGWIDVDQGIIHRLPDGEAETNKRKGRARVHQALLPHLRRWRRQDLARGITHCIHYQGEPVSSVSKSWRWVARQAGAQDGPHICRHTCITWLLQSGVNAHEAGGFAGVSPLVIERTYGHHSPDFQWAAARARGR